jgi:hypothetical protein
MLPVPPKASVPAVLEVLGGADGLAVVVDNATGVFGVALVPGLCALNSGGLVAWPAEYPGRIFLMGFPYVTRFRSRVQIGGVPPG